MEPFKENPTTKMLDVITVTIVLGAPLVTFLVYVVKSAYAMEWINPFMHMLIAFISTLPISLILVIISLSLSYKGDYTKRFLAYYDEKVNKITDSNEMQRLIHEMYGLATVENGKSAIIILSYPKSINELFARAIDRKHLLDTLNAKKEE